MRNKVLYICIFILAIPLGVWSQSVYKYEQIRAVGVKAAGNFFLADLQPREFGIAMEPAYSAGLVYVFSNKKYVGVQMELLYSERKWVESYDSLSMHIGLQYLEIPLMTNISLGNGRVKYIINLGTYFALNFSKNQEADFPADNAFYQSVLQRKERSGDFGLLMGGAVRYISKAGIFQFDARFVFGYQKLYNEEATGFKRSGMLGGQIGLIYLFNFIKE